MKNLIISSTRLAVTITWMFFLCVSFFFNQLLDFWLSTDEYGTYAVWGILALGNLFISAIYGSIFRVMFVTGKTSVLFKMDSLTATLNAVISILLTIQFGWYGVIAGTTIQLLIVLIVLSLYAKRNYAVGFSDLLPLKYVFYFVATLVLSFVIYFIHDNFPQYWPLFFSIQMILLLTAGFLLLKKDVIVRQLI